MALSTPRCHPVCDAQRLAQHVGDVPPQIPICRTAQWSSAQTNATVARFETLEANRR